MYMPAGKNGNRLVVTDEKQKICMYIYTDITEVNLSVFIYRLFHEDFSSLIGTKYIYTYTYIMSVYIHICQKLLPPLAKGGYVFGTTGLFVCVFIVSNINQKVMEGLCSNLWMG